MPAFAILLAVVAVAGGGVAAIAGFGIGSLVTPVVALSVGTKVAVLLVAIPHFVATALRFWLLRDAVDRQVLLTFGIASAAGGLFGALLHAAFSSRILAVLLGALLVFAAASGLSGLSRRLRLPPGPVSVAAGLLSGAFGGLVGNQGGIRTAALLHLDLPGRTLVATATGIGLAVDLARIPVYLATGGDVIARNWPTVLLLAVAVVFGTLAGAPLLRRIPEPAFRAVVFVLVGLLGLALIAGLAG